MRKARPIREEYLSGEVYSAKLKDEYIYLKDFLNIAGVNLTELDKIKD